MVRKVLDVFLSSTAIDLARFRAEVHKRLNSKGIFHCVRQEDFGAQDAGAVEYCRKRVQAADFFVGLIGLRRGWEPDGDETQRSITEMEHDWAREAGVRRHVWVAPPEFPVPGHIRESDALYGRQQAFRTNVMANGERIVSQAGFGSPALLAADVVDRLLIEVVTGDLIKELRPELSGPSGSTAEEQRPAIAAAVEKLVEDDDIDLQVLAENPEGADLAALEAKLKARAEKLGTASAKYWRHIGALAFLHDTQKALAAYEKAVTFDPGDPEGWRFLGELHFRLGDLASAEKSFTMLSTFPENRPRSMGCLRLGWIYCNRGDLIAAEEFAKEALSLSQREQWAEGTARAYRNLGVYYQTRGDLDLAEKMYLEALALEDALGGKEGMAAAYSNLAVIYRERGELNLAEEMLHKALNLNEAVGRKEGMATAYSNLGTIYQERGELNQAEEMYIKALALEDALGRKDGMAIDYRNLGTIYEARSEKTRMCECWRKARDLWLQMGLEDKASEIDGYLRFYGCDPH